MDTGKKQRPMNLMMIVGAMEVMMGELEETGSIIDFGPSYDRAKAGKLLVTTSGLAELANAEEWELGDAPDESEKPPRFSHVASVNLHGVRFYSYLTPEEHKEYRGEANETE